MIANIYENVATSQKNLSPKKFLLLDDDRFFVNKLTREAKAFGSEAIPFDRFEKMADILQNTDEFFDGLITELKIGNQDAFSIYDAVKENRPNLKIIVVTAYGGVESAVSAIKYGFEHYYSKPTEFALIQKTFDDPSNIPTDPSCEAARNDNMQEFMTADRVRWEHIQRVYHVSGYNVSETARRLKMHRRTLQRILSKHAPK